MILTHKIQLKPNNKQATYFAKACGVARFVYNWALAKWKELYDAGEKTSGAILDKQLNAIKRQLFPGMMDVTCCAPQQAIRNLETAFKNFFTKRTKFPAFKKKGQHDSFGITNTTFSVKNDVIRIPKLGNVKMTQTLRFKGKIMGAVISRIADKWFISISVEVPDPTPIHDTNSPAVGVDLGVKDLATLSDGTKITGAKPYKKLKRRVRRLNKSLSRKQGSKRGERKSNNFRKALKKLSRLYAKIANIRKDCLHKLTTMLTRKFGIIGIENLTISGMVKNHNLAQAILDMGFYEFKRQLEYKAKITGSKVIIADRFYPSSKQCSHCGEKYNDLTLSMREWICPHCNTHHDRDINAAINLKNYAVRYTVSACGELADLTASMKQELNVKTLV